MVDYWDTNIINNPQCPHGKYLCQHLIPLLYLFSFACSIRSVIIFFQDLRFCFPGKGKVVNSMFVQLFVTGKNVYFFSGVILQVEKNRSKKTHL